MFQLPLFHKLIAMILLGVAANLDNLGVGIAYGTADLKIRPAANFLIAVISMLLAWIAVVAGRSLGDFLPLNIANIAGASIIVAVGIWVAIHQSISEWIEEMRSNGKWQSQPLNDDILTKNSSLSLSNKKILLLGFSLSINAMAGGVGAGLSGYNPQWVALGIGIFSYLTIDCGQYLGKAYIGKWLGAYAHWAAGILLVLIGIYEFFT